MTMQRVRLGNLWKCHPTKQKKSRTAADRAVARATKECNREIRLLEIKRSALKAKLADISRLYQCSRRSNVAVRMAEIIVEIENLNTKIIELRK